MKIIVFSDSHGDLKYMKQAVERERPNHILHLGDMLRDAWAVAREFPDIPIDYVPGNCDFSPDQPVKLLLELEGRKILMTHGHIYRVKQGPGAAVEAARAAGADILLYGHTHQDYTDLSQGFWVMNPGSVRFGLRTTYGVITLEGDRTECRTIVMERKCD